VRQYRDEPVSHRCQDPSDNQSKELRVSSGIARWSPSGTLLTVFVAVAAPDLIQAQRQPEASASAGMPQWLHVSGTQRTRYEHLWNQLGSTTRDNDMALSLRSTLLAEFSFAPVAVVIELADSRTYLRDAAAPVTVSLVNPLDILQAHVSIDIPNFLTNDALLRMRIGRQTMDIGSRRFVARNRFRNTINAFGGLSIEWTSRDRHSLRAFVAVPVERRVDPSRVNGLRLDRERFESVFWGVSVASRHLTGSVTAEFNLFGIHERDSERFSTTNRRFIAPGLRLYRDPETGRVDFEIEGVTEAGLSRLTRLPQDTADLRHFAFFLHASLGHTFIGGVRPRFLLQYDYASGDKDPFDDSNGRFDTLFGARRFEFGPTGIYGALGRSNISSPGARVEMQPARRLEVFLAYRAAWLAQERDAWTTTLIRDEAGNSGTFVGHQIEGRVRWTIMPDHATLEAGMARLWLGGFPKSAPNGASDARDPTYAYGQFALQF
jgi:hypothetical protein